jgi:hypothetical protein
MKMIDFNVLDEIFEQLIFVKMLRKVKFELFGLFF